MRPDDFGGFRGFRRVPLVGDGIGMRRRLEDGELGGELALEGVDAAAEFGDGHGNTSGLMVLNVAILGKSRSFLFI